MNNLDMNNLLSKFKRENNWMERERNIKNNSLLDTAKELGFVESVTQTGTYIPLLICTVKGRLFIRNNKTPLKQLRKQDE